MLNFSSQSDLKIIQLFNTTSDGIKIDNYTNF